VTRDGKTIDPSHWRMVRLIMKWYSRMRSERRGGADGENRTGDGEVGKSFPKLNY